MKAQDTGKQSLTSMFHTIQYFSSILLFSSILFATAKITFLSLSYNEIGDQRPFFHPESLSPDPSNAKLHVGTSSGHSTRFL